MTPLPGLELETSGFDTMLCFMHQPDEPKSLSHWEEWAIHIYFTT